MATDTRNLYERLRDFRNDVPTIGFDRDVKAGQRRYSYVTLGKLVDTIAPVLDQHGLLLTQSVQVDGVRTYLNVVTEPNSASIMSTVPINSVGLNSQELGSAITYARRYGIITILGLVPEEDDDGAAASQAPEAPRAAPRIPRTSDPEPAAPEGWGSAKESATAHTALSDRIGKLDAGQRSICSEFREANGGWPLPKKAFEELSNIVALMESGLTDESEGKF